MLINILLYIVFFILCTALVQLVVLFRDVWRAKKRIKEIFETNGMRTHVDLDYDLERIDSLINSLKNEICRLQNTVAELRYSIQEDDEEHAENMDKIEALRGKLESIHDVLFESGIIKKETDVTKTIEPLKEFINNQFEMSKAIKEILELYSLTE